MAVRNSAAGFTILELMVVMGVISVLFGLGFGFMQGSASEVEIAESILRDQLRVAGLTARTRHLPTEVEILPASDIRPVSMRARILSPVGHWHMEPDERWPAGGLTPELYGDHEPGRYGYAMRPEPDGASLLTLSTEDKAFFDLRSGFALRIEVRLEAREEMVLVRLGDSIELRLDSELRPQGSVALTGENGGRGSRVSVYATKALSLQPWHSLQLVHDGTELRILVDDRVLDRADAPGQLFQDGAEEFVVSPSDRPVLGLVDEVQLLAYEFTQTQELPFGVSLSSSAGRIVFDRYGEVVGSPVFRLLSDTDEERMLRLGAGGLLQ
ncbi:MAG: prepilin-type N-terminal cleavage/methylation domain-containing protein [Planctomycetota bacterium]|jgi:prepilin-type N-terminal cleavage/methylation domain-containing protein